MDDNSQEVAENSEQSIQTETIEEIVPKRRGRPAVSKDKAPRRTKTIIVEAREPSPPREAAAPAQVAPASPRTLFQQASRHMTILHEEREKARRAYWQDTISKSLR